MSLRLVHVFTISRQYVTKKTLNQLNEQLILKRKQLVGALSANPFHLAKLKVNVLFWWLKALRWKLLKAKIVFQVNRDGRRKYHGEIKRTTMFPAHSRILVWRSKFVAPRVRDSSTPSTGYKYKN